jgi:(p)ppGpp synthase/HD superfamily hydrolase
MTMYKRALALATVQHAGQIRKFSGEAYVNHPIRVAQIVLKYKESREIDILRVAALLHDVVEDSDMTIEEISEEFGLHIASIVEELTTDSRVSKKEKGNHLCDKTVHMTSWALVIKLADRLDNVSDLRHTSKQFRQSYIKETRKIISHLIAVRSYLSMTHLQLVHEILKEINGVAKLDIV